MPAAIPIIMAGASMVSQNAQNHANQQAATQAQSGAQGQNQAATQAAMQRFMHFLMGNQSGQPMPQIPGGGMSFGGGVTGGAGGPIQGGNFTGGQPPQGVSGGQPPQGPGGLGGLQAQPPHPDLQSLILRMLPQGGQQQPPRPV